MQLSNMAYEAVFSMLFNYPAETTSSYKTWIRSMESNNYLYLGLSKTEPNADGTGATEPSGCNYSRVQITSSLSKRFKSKHLNESTATLHQGLVGNTRDIIFPEARNPSDINAATGGDWTTGDERIRYWILFSSATGTTPFAWGELSQPVEIKTHDIFTIRAGEFEAWLVTGREGT